MPASWTDLPSLFKEKRWTEISTVLETYERTSSWKQGIVGNMVRETIKAHDIEHVRFFLARRIEAHDKAGIDDDRDAKRRSFLYFAVEAQSFEVVELLVQEGARITIAELQLAVKMGQAAILEYLLGQDRSKVNEDITKKIDYFLRYDTTLLIEAAENNDHIIARILINFGAKADSALFRRYDYFQKTKNKDPDAVEKFHRSLKFILPYAIGYNFDNLDFLGGIDISGLDFIGKTLRGMPITKKMLMEMGFTGFEQAIVSLQDLKEMQDSPRKEILQQNLEAAFGKIGRFTDEAGIVDLAPHEWAIKRGDLAAVKMRVNFPKFDKSELPHLIKMAEENNQIQIANFLQAVLGINHHDANGMTLLHRATTKRDIPTIQFCLEEKANLDLPNKAGATALHIAAGFSTKVLTEADLTIITMLIEAKADVNICVEGNTALNFAARSGSLAAMKLLINVTQKKDYLHEHSGKICPWYVPLMFDSCLSPDWLEILTLLKGCGADLNQCNEKKESLISLHIYQFNLLRNKFDNDTVLKRFLFLFENGVSPFVKHEGQIALLFLTESQYTVLPEKLKPQYEQVLAKFLQIVKAPNVAELMDKFSIRAKPPEPELQPNRVEKRKERSFEPSVRGKS